MGGSRATQTPRIIIICIGAVLFALVFYFSIGAKAQEEAQPPVVPDPAQELETALPEEEAAPLLPSESPAEPLPAEPTPPAELSPAEPPPHEAEPPPHEDESPPEPEAPPDEPPPPPFEFPIPELGNCADTGECQSYCDDLSHREVCAEFGAKHGLISEDDAEKAADLPPTGPGGCQGEAECKVYCQDLAHGQECLDFAVQNGLMSEDEIKKAELLLEGKGLGGCSSPEECKAFCEDPSNHDVCFEFAKENELLGQEEIAEIEAHEKALEDFEEGPGGCESEDKCRAYCQDTAHADECLEFGVKQGVISEEEAKRFKKLALGGGPGGCKGEVECKAYCDEPSHQAECIDFAVENGFMSKEEAKFAKKLAGKTGPGGCRGQECRAYCENPANMEACISFAGQEGLISSAELAQARKFMKIAQEGGPGGCHGGIECKNYCESSDHQDECFSFAKGKGLLNPEDERNFEIGKKLQQKVKESGGPGGCHDDNECRSYCGEPGHVEECVAFGSAHAGISEEEVRKMLKDFTTGHMGPPGEFGPPEDIRRFEKEVHSRFEQFRDLESRFRGGEGSPGMMPFGGPGGPGGMMSGGMTEGDFTGSFSGPGGCKTPAECMSYCREHLEECRHVDSSGAPPPREGQPPGSEIEKILPPTTGQEVSPTSRSAAAISLDKEPTGLFRLVIRDRDGLQEFSLALSSGSNYGSGLTGCPREYVNNTVRFTESDFPITAAYVIDCTGTKHDLTLAPPYGPSVAPSIPSETIPYPDLHPPAGLELPAGLPTFPSPATGGNAKVYLVPLYQYGPDKYSIVVEDPDGVKEFSVIGSGGQGLYGGGYNTYRPCNDSENLKRPSSTVTIPISYFPLKATVSDCNGQKQDIPSVVPSAPTSLNPLEDGLAQIGTGILRILGLRP